MAEKALSGGDALMKRLAEIYKQVTKAGTLRVGFLEGGGIHAHSNLPVAAVAAIQEFGAPSRGIPPRSFMRVAVAKHSDEWGDSLAGALKHFDYDAAAALNAVGWEQMVPDITDAIVNVSGPPLSEVTRMLRMMKQARENHEITSWKDVAEARARVERGERASGINEALLQDTKEMIKAVAAEVKA